MRQGRKRPKVSSAALKSPEFDSFCAKRAQVAPIRLIDKASENDNAIVEGGTPASMKSTWDAARRTCPGICLETANGTTCTFATLF
jgi:hypothetical protein